MYMKKIFFFFILSFFAAYAVANQVDSLAVDSIPPVGDTLVVTHPAPVHLRPRAAAPLAAACPVDSVVCVDNDGNLVSLVEYVYDEAGNTALETSYRWIGGIRTGVLRTRKIYNGSAAVVTINYNWNADTQNWVGRDSTVLLYEGNTNIGSAFYVLENNEWRYETLYEYAFNDSGKRILSRYSKWDNSAQTLVFVNKYEWEFDAAGNQTVASYWLYNNAEWEGKTKTVNAYDADKNKILEEKYSGWENNDWIGTSKNTYVYNSDKKLTEQITYKWSDGWVEQIKQVQDYDGANIIETASYIWYNGDWYGNNRSTKTFTGKKVESETVWAWNTEDKKWQESSLTEYTYIGGNVHTTTISAWTGTDWLPYTQQVNTYGESGKIENEALSVWRNEIWNDSLRTIYTYDTKGNNTLKVTDKWVNEEWLPSDSVRHVITYITINEKDYPTLDMQEQWSAAGGVWTGKSRTETQYDEAGNATQIDTYNFSSGDWVYNSRRQYAYKNNNGKLVTFETVLNWDNSKHQWVGKSKFERDFNDSGKQIMSSTYKWNKSHNDWEGVGRSADIYENNVKTTSYAYKWDAEQWDWTGMFKYDYLYDAAGHTIQQLVSSYNAQDDTYLYSTKTTYDYNSRNKLVRTNSYSWILALDDWCLTSTDESDYDEDSDAKLRSKLTASWTNCELTAYEKQQYYYKCDTKIFTVTFNNWDGTALLVVQVTENTVPEYTETAPQRDADAQYTYTFTGWDKELAAVTEDVVYTAQYEAVVNKYKVTFLDEDGQTVLDEQEVAYGDVPEYAGEQPAKTADEQYVYTFTGWDKEIVAVIEDAVYIAQYEATANQFTIRFLNYDGTELQVEQLTYGATPEYTGATPVRDATDEEVFTFSGWSPEITTVTADADYTAQYTSQQISQLWFTVTFVDYDDTPLKTVSVRYGQYPIFGDAAPTRPAEGNNVYEFIGWEPALQPVTADITYKAVYSVSELPTADYNLQTDADNDTVYNLLGIPVSNNYKGVVIQNGKKYFRY